MAEKTLIGFVIEGAIPGLPLPTICELNWRDDSICSQALAMDCQRADHDVLKSDSSRLCKTAVRGCLSI